MDGLLGDTLVLPRDTQRLVLNLITDRAEVGEASIEVQELSVFVGHHPMAVRREMDKLQHKRSTRHNPIPARKKVTPHDPASVSTPLACEGGTYVSNTLDLPED